MIRRLRIIKEAGNQQMIMEYLRPLFFWIPPPDRPLFQLFYSKAIMGGVAAVSKAFLTFGSYTGVYNMNPFLKILYDTHRTRPLLTGKQNKEYTKDAITMM